MPIQVEDNPTLFYSTLEAAELIKVSRITIMRWIAKGELKARKIGKGYVISSHAIHDLLTGREK